MSSAISAPMRDIASATSARIDRGADYSLQADRMSVQLQQMYGMSNAQVRNQLRTPLTEHYLLGGGTAINDLLGMQASTGLSAARQASTVEAFRTVSGFSLGTQDVTKMLTSMASPDVANRMFMMGGTGMYGVGGEQRTGMQTMQDIVRQTGLTNPEALKGALQQGSNTRQRLTAMGVPQDMQDMVIQYAMQNQTFQKKTSDKGMMYDPSVESDRRTMGIEGSYAVQHEKTTGERLKREEGFYGRQVDNFATFERNLRTVTKALAGLEDALSGIIGMGISAKGHPVTQVAQSGFGYTQGIFNAMGNVAASAVDLGIPGGDPTVEGNSPAVQYSSKTPSASGSTTKLSDHNERKLATLDAKLAIPLRKMLQANPKLSIGDARRSSKVQEESFKMRYSPRPDLKEKTQSSDRWWNGVLWVHDNHAAPAGSPAMAAPGTSWHEKGLAADVRGDNDWLIANASKYGLGHGGTGTGQADDEPFHIQTADTMGKMPGGSGEGAPASKTSIGSATPSGSVRSAGAVRRVFTSTQSADSSSYVDTNAGQRATAVAKEGLGGIGSIIGGTDKPSRVSTDLSTVGRGTTHGGDPTVGNSSRASSSGGGGGSMQITISPNIYLQGNAGNSSDLQKMAKEVASLLEREVRLTMMRSS